MKYRNIILSVSIVLILMFSLSFLVGLPYIHTLLIISAWVAFGHLFTLDDDMPEGWSNLENDLIKWRMSKMELLIKFVIFLFVLFLIIEFPSITVFGA